MIKASQRVHEGYFHTSDVLPTLASAAGFKIGNVDGFDQWNVLVNGGKSPRKEIVTSLDPIFGFSGIISDKWKFVNGTTYGGAFDIFLGKIEEFSVLKDSHANAVLSSRAGKAIAAARLSRQPALTASKITNLRKRLTISCNEFENEITRCSPLKSPCLFNIIDDPCERRNLAEVFPEIVKKLRQRMIDLVRTSAPIRRTAVSDPRCDPAKHKGIWGWWTPDSIIIPDKTNIPDKTMISDNSRWILQLLEWKLKILNFMKQLLERN